MTSSAQSSKHGAPDHAVALFDGVCGLCNSSVRWIAVRDVKDLFRFAPLDSEPGKTLRAQYGIPDELDAMVVLDGNRWYAGADAALFILHRLGGIYAVGAGVLGLVPRGIREAAYRLIARKRKKWFGRVEYCSVRTDNNREKFLSDHGERNDST